MPPILQLLNRGQIDTRAWDACVTAAPNALVYGYSWYLDAATNVPGGSGPTGSWAGVVWPGPTAGYLAVLPVPLRRRWGQWVVYQPLFCQFLALFSRQPVDPAPFIRLVYDHYRHGSVWQLYLPAPLVGLPANLHQQVSYTHELPLSPPPTYTADRRQNLRRANRRIANIADWQVTQTNDCKPLIELFKQNHAARIGVGDWAYDRFRAIFSALRQRGLASLWYAYANGKPVAGTLFVQQHGRIIYLFNAADTTGRHLNARSLLIDARVKTGQETETPLVLDFESPEKEGIVQFYESFGAQATPFLRLSWSRVTRPEKWIKRGLATLNRQRT